MRPALGSLRPLRSAAVNFLTSKGKTRPTSTATAILGLAVLLATVLIVGSGEAQATGPGAPEAGFDMVSDGSNTGSTLGTIQTCVEVPATVGGTFIIDTFLDAIPTGEDLDGWNYAMVFPDTVVKLITDDYNVSMTPTPAFTSLSEGAGGAGAGAGDDLISPQNVTVANLGQGTSAPAGTLGVLGRYTFQVTAATAGTYDFSFTAGLTNFVSSTLNDWTASVSFANFGIGTLALGTTCPPPRGDVDCSGGVAPVSAVDAVKVLRHVANLLVSQNEPCDDIGTGGPPLQGDIDCDNDVDAVDALRLLRFVAGLNPNLPQGCPPIGL